MSGATLGLDVGSVRIGVAICEGRNVPAVPLLTIERSTTARAIGEIVRVAAERGARTIVVGYPLRLDGTTGPATRKIDSFVKTLQERFGGTIVLHDERLTTLAAAKRLRDLDLSGSKRRARVDQLAAVEILDSYLAASRRV